ncbi:MAG: S-adenosyl-l-methionine hydroxide adenosyltransferase family protein [Candidatus Binatia bacterium]
MRAAIITLLTDFGVEDAFVGVMKGVVLGINPQVQLVDLTHAIPPQQIMAGALVLRHAVTFFPPGTIHVAVVDPGVGSVRRPIAVRTAKGFLVGPDNGLLWPAARVSEVHSARLIANAALLRHPVSQTFHGRDVFAPVAAHLSRGIDPQEVGPELSSIVELPFPVARRTGSAISGAVVYVDHFGNLVTNIEVDAVMRFAAKDVSVSIGTRRVVGLATTYTAVPEGMPVAVLGSWGLLEIAVRNGNAAQVFAAGPGVPVSVVLEPRDA